MPPAKKRDSISLQTTADYSSISCSHFVKIGKGRVNGKTPSVLGFYQNGVWYLDCEGKLWGEYRHGYGKG